MLTRMYQAEPILILLTSGTGLLTALFQLSAAFNHPFTDAQQHAISGVCVVLGAVLARASVVSPASNQQQIAEQKMASKLGGGV